MEIHLQTTDHVVAVEKVAEQHIGTKLCSCNTYEDISHLLIMVIKKFIRTCDLPKMCNCSSFRENCVTHARIQVYGVDRGRWFFTIQPRTSLFLCLNIKF